MDNKKIGLFIASLRKNKNMTQEELGDALYVSDKAVSKWERGLSMPDIGIISSLATILDVSVSEILKGEKINKLDIDSKEEIIKNSIPFFQRKYFKNKIIKILIGLIIFIIVAFTSILIIGEINNGEVELKIYGQSYYLELPSFSSKKALKNSSTFLKALQTNDYETIENILMNHHHVDETSSSEYITNLKNLKKEGFKILDYKYIYHYYNNLGYVTSFDIVFEYNKVKYTVSPQIEAVGSRIATQGLGWTDLDYFKVNNPVIVLEEENNELYQKIERIFRY